MLSTFTKQVKRTIRINFLILAEIKIRIHGKVLNPYWVLIKIPHQASQKLEAKRMVLSQTKLKLQMSETIAWIAAETKKKKKILSETLFWLPEKELATDCL